MTNTLHRFGKASSFRDDIIVIALPAKGSQSGDPLPALRRFLEIAREYKPVNIGDSIGGAALRSTRYKSFFAHWFRRNKPDFDQVIKTLTIPTTMSAVFDNLAAAQAFVKRLREEDMGISVNISSSLENAKSCCEHAGIPRHSVNYSLGFDGIGENVPNKHGLMLSTMCGHGMISHALAEKMIAFVKEGRRTPFEAAQSMQRFCSCGIFNTSRAVRILEDAKIGAKEEFSGRTRCCGNNCPDCPFRTPDARGDAQMALAGTSANP